MSAAIPLLLLTHLRFQGPDAERYLNGQVTQQVEGLQPGQSRYTFVCDAKGRILFDATIHCDDDGFLLTIDGGEREELIARMDRYLIADDCELRDESERWIVLHQPGDGGMINRFGTAGTDRYLAREEFTESSELFPSAQELENLRISEGVPRLADLVGALPAETGLEESAVSFHKGCYLGQEVVSRMKRAGKTNRRLVKVALDSVPKELPADFTAEKEGKPLLQVTSVAETKIESGFPALGYLNARHGGEPLSNQKGISAHLVS